MSIKEIQKQSLKDKISYQITQIVFSIYLMQYNNHLSLRNI